MHWTDHTTVGLQYALTASFFLLVGFLLVIAMRWQLAWPTAPLPPVIATVVGGNNASSGYMLPEFYHQLVAMHGTVMIFLAVVPLLAGAFGNYLVPLMIGAGDMAFPRLNAASYWLYLPGGLVMLASFFAPGGGPMSGWTTARAARRLRIQRRRRGARLCGANGTSMSTIPWSYRERSDTKTTNVRLGSSCFSPQKQCSSGRWDAGGVLNARHAWMMTPVLLAATLVFSLKGHEQRSGGPRTMGYRLFATSRSRSLPEAWRIHGDGSGTVAAVAELGSRLAVAQMPQCV